MKTKSSKKVVGAVRRLVAGTVSKAKMLEKKGVAALKRAEGAWDSTKPRRDRIVVAAKGVLERAERKTGEIARKAVQAKDDIATGIREGLKDAKKAAKK